MISAGFDDALDGVEGSPGEGDNAVPRLDCLQTSNQPLVIHMQRAEALIPLDLRECQHVSQRLEDRL